MAFSALWQQFFPPAPSFTEKDTPAGSQVGKVFIITGANGGLGLALAKLLYPTGATIYLAGRSPVKIQKAIEEISSSTSPSPETPSTLKSLHLDLSDLESVRPAAAAFAAQESRLDILWNNAGVSVPVEKATKQGLEIHVGANCIAPLLFTQELLPLLQAAAKTAPKNSVRVVWSGSLHIDMTAPPGGVDFERIRNPSTTVTRLDYALSKAGNWFLAVEGARRWGKDGSKQKS
jgi:NAD(P)-dependent dehydrogenase (short-subunit alcohol dehydrogenase family)